MKREGGSSAKKLPTAPESAEIYDFLYVDRARVSALYAQLFSQGVLTNVKTSALQTFSDEGNVGADIKVFKTEAKTMDGGSEGIEHSFDTSWSIPLDVLAGLRRHRLVRDSLKDAGLGSIILTDCLLRVIDFASMDNLWEPGMKIYLASTQPPVLPPPLTMDLFPTIVEAMKALPHTIHAHFLTREGHLWSSLQPESLTIQTSDLTLKYGGQVAGLWKLLYLYDAWPDLGEAPNLETWSAGDVVDGILKAMHILKTGFGRPPHWYGVTPLMIYRSISGWVPLSIPLPGDDSPAGG